MAISATMAKAKWLEADIGDRAAVMPPPEMRLRSRTTGLATGLALRGFAFRAPLRLPTRLQCVKLPPAVRGRSACAFRFVSLHSRLC